MTTTGDLHFRKRELFRVLRYQPHPGQVLVHRSTASRRVLACGTRWGKTTCAAVECIAALMEPRDQCLGWLVAPTYDLTDRIFKRVVRLLTTHFAYRIRLHIPREHRIVVTNLGGGESELRAKSADRPESLLGEALDFLIVDEAAAVRDDVWSQYLSPRLIDRKGWSLVISTPRGQGWFQRECNRAQRDSDYERWRAPTSANPHIDPATIEAERSRLSADTFASQFEGRFTGPPEPCPFCHGPSPRAEGCTIKIGDDPVLHCRECGLPCGRDGFTLVKLTQDGKPVFSVRRMMLSKDPPTLNDLRKLIGLKADEPIPQEHWGWEFLGLRPFGGIVREPPPLPPLPPHVIVPAQARPAA
jgi:hypothetical protein